MSATTSNIDNLPRYISNAAALKAGLKPGELFRWGKNIYMVEAVEKEYRVSTSVEKEKAMSLLTSIVQMSAGQDVPGNVRGDIFVPGNSYYFSADNDFNALYGLNPGDVVLIPAGSYPSIDILKADGITFKNYGGKATIGHFNLGPGVKDCKILGNGHSGTTYGIKVIDPDRFGLGLSCTGNIEIGWVESDGNILGIQLVGQPGPTYAVNSQNLYLHDCKVSNSIQEAVYLGYYIVGGIYMTALVERIVVVNAGADGIQCRNGSFQVYDCNLNGIGLNGDSINAQGVLFGGNTNGGKAKRNVMRNVGGFGIFCNGWGSFEFSCNDMQTNSSGIFTKNYEYDQDLQNVGYQNISEHDNIIVAANNIAFEHYYRTASEAGASGPNKPVTATATNNKTSNGSNIQPGVGWTSTNNNNSVIPSCS